jgi:surface protein
MFNNYNSLTSIDLSGWDTNNVTNMSYMFNNCNSLTSIDLSSWNTNNVTNMSYMFHSCSNLQTIRVPDDFVVKYSARMFE